MKTINEDAYLKSLNYWIYHTDKLKDTFPKDLFDPYMGWWKNSTTGKKRNVENIDLPKQEGDDIMNLF